MMKTMCLVLAGAAALAISSCDSASKETRKLEHPLVVIGIDGGEWDVIESMIARGELPNLAMLIESGVSGHLVNPGPAISPPVWTTFATGHFPREHGILDHVYPYDDSPDKGPVSSVLRLKPTIWNLASDYGLESSVIGYFVTWPAENINGTMVSDRALNHLENSITPQAAREDYEEIFTELSDENVWPQVLAAYFPWGYEREQAFDEEHPHHSAAKQIIYRSDGLFVKDEAHRRVIQSTPIDSTDLFIAYYRSPDIASHSFWKYYDDSTYEQPASDEMKRDLGNVVEESYRFVDRAMGELMVRFGDTANYVVLSDHGFRAVKEQQIDAGSHVWELTGNHRLNGVFIASGPDFTSGTIEMMTSLDVMPTLAFLLCLPVSDELPGSAQFRIVRPEFDERCPLQTVTSYAASAVEVAAAEADSEDQESVMQELRGLGYVGTEVGVGDGQRAGELNFWNSTERVVTIHVAGELVFYILRENPEVALSIINELRANRPELENDVRAYTVESLRRLSINLPHKPPLLDLVQDLDEQHQLGWMSP